MPVSVPSRRAIGRTSVPRVQLVIPANELAQDIAEGVKELAKHAIRQNVRILEQGEAWQDVHAASGVDSGTKSTWLVQ